MKMYNNCSLTGGETVLCHLLSNVLDTKGEEDGASLSHAWYIGTF